jgi:hypothetical protein
MANNNSLKKATNSGSNSASANGNRASANGNRASANGNKASANGNSASANSNKASANGNRASANGKRASANGNSASANGNKASANGNSASANGNSASANKSNSLSFNSNNSNSNSNSNSNNNLSNIANITNKVNSVKSESSDTIIYVGIGILIIILAVAGYFIYRHYNTTRKSAIVTKNFIPLIHDSSIDKRINYGSIPESSQGNEYNVNMWVYVNDYVYRKDEDKCILYKGDVIGTLNNAEPENNINTKCNPSLWLLKNVNTLRVLIGLETKYDSNKDCNQTLQACGEVIDSETCDIENFPLQKWVNVNISLRSNVLDIFLDGNLHKSCILGGFPIINKGDLFICKDGGYNGYLSNLKYSNKALPSGEIAKIYKNGPTLK